MKSKRLLLLLLLAIGLPWAAMAQNTLTVCDGSASGTTTATNNYIPIYGLYVDTQGQNSEFIIPAETQGMSDMEGGTISKLAFYITNSPDTWGSPTVQVYMGEVEGTTLSSLNGPTNFTTVWTGTLSNQSATMEITLSEPYTYEGGNLLIGMYVQTKSTTYKTTSFSGITAPSGSSRYNSGSGSGSAVSFLPKTTFTYEPAQQGGDVCEMPATCVVSNVTGTSATLTWSGGSGTYNVEVKGGSYTDWTPVLQNTTLLTTPLSLQPTTTYQARVQSVCTGDTPTSYWKNCASFTTPCSAYTVTNDAYTYDFENAAPLGCWTPIAGAARNENSSQAHGGSWYLKFSGTTNNMIAFPQFTEEISTLRLEFYTRPESNTNSSCGNFAVGYMTDLSNPNSFVAVDTYTYSDWSSASYVKKTASFTNAPAGAYIAMRQYNCSTAWYWFVDDVTVSVPVTVTANQIVASNPGTNQMTWHEFAEHVNAGHDFTSNTITLMENITITEMVGTEENPFTGIFEGNNKTITADITSGEKAAAPFHYIKDATIKNLTMTGTVTETATTSDGYHAGGLVGYAWSGTNTILNCRVSTDVTITTYGSGIIGHAKASTINMTGCVYDGNITNTTATTDGNSGVGGLIGWCDNGATLNLNSCVFDGTYGGDGASVLFHPVVCGTGNVNTSVGSRSTFTNVYYTLDQQGTDSGSVNVISNCGKHAYSISGDTGIAVNMSGEYTEYDMSGITAYASNYGLLYNNGIIAGDGDQVVLTLSGADNYGANHGELSASGNNYSLLMEAYDTQISPVSCPKPTSLAVTTGSVTAHGATITWTENGEATEWTVEYTTDPDFETGISTATAETTPSYTFGDPRLAGGITYYVRVKAVCGVGNESLYSNVASFTTAIACPAPSSFTAADVTNHTAKLTWDGDCASYNVRYGALNTTTTVLSTGFEDNTIPAALTNDASLPWTVTAGGANSSSYCAIPGNQGEDSSDSDLTFVVAGPGTVSFNAKVSSESNYDYGRFLIDNSQKMNISGTQDWTAYEYELSAGTHTLVWRYHKDVSTASGADLFYVDNITITALTVSTWQNANNNVSEEVTLQGLDPETKYEAYLTGDCSSSGDGYSAEVGPVTFTTDIACPAPSTFAVSNVKSDRADLSWTNGGSEDWIVAYKKTADERFTEVNVRTADVTIEGTTVTYTLTGLDETTEYIVKVADNCEPTYTGDGQSEWTSTVSFTTMSACEVENVTVNDITHYTANVSWDGESASGFTVKYRTAAYIDGIEEGFDSGNLPSGWENKTGLLSTIIDGGAFSTSTQWSFGNSNSVFDYHARINIYGGGSTERHGWLITPEFTLPSGAALSFDLALTAYSGTGAASGTCDDDRFVVLVYADNAWEILREWNNSGSGDVYNNIPTAGQNVNIDLSNYVGKTVKIAFYGESTVSGNGDNNLHIDNVTIGTPVPAGTEQTFSATDSPVNLENLEAGTKYEVKVVPNCDENMANDWVSFTTVSANEKWFITEGNWGTAANWEPAGAPTIDQTVELRANATITGEAFAKSITGTGTGEGTYTLTIENGGKLKHLNSGVRATVKKTINAWTVEGSDTEDPNGYYLIANPLTGSVTPDAENNHLLSGNYDLYGWDYTQDLEWRNNVTSLSSGVYGYLYANAQGTTLTYTGTLNAYTSYKSRSASAPSNPDSYDFPGWYLLGNPYMYDAYLTNTSTGGTALPYIKMNAAGDGFENVAAGTPIAPMVGFFYEASSNASYAYVNTVAPTAQSGSKLNMNLRKGNKQLDNAILVFGDNQQLGKFTFRANSSKVYMPKDGKDYAIVSTESNVGALPVNFKAENNGSYTLSFNAEEVSFAYLHLIDNMTGIETDLLANPSYSFEARTTDYESRFKLVFATGNSTDDTFAFYSNGSFVINNEGEATLQVIDVNGRILKSESINGCANVNVKAAAGVYVLRLVNGNDVKVQKVVVR